MSDILENDLVRKYFGCEKGAHGACDGKRNDCMERTAFRVLKSMQEPIRKGEQAMWLWYRQVHDDWIVGPWDGTKLDDYHPYVLRLPDRFQTAGKKDIFDLPADFKLWGYSLAELRSMRNFAESRGWMVPINQPPPEQEQSGMSKLQGRKPAEPEKCGHTEDVKDCYYCKPSDAVEAKIEEIINLVSLLAKYPSYDPVHQIGDWCRELVKLAREEK